MDSPAPTPAPSEKPVTLPTHPASANRTPYPATDLTGQQKLAYDLITSNLQEILNPEILISHLQDAFPTSTTAAPPRPLKIYWGTAITGRPHAGYFVPALKLAQFLRAGCELTILLADVHALIDGDKCPEEQLTPRTTYYERVIKALLSSVGVDLSKLRFIRGTSFQEQRPYTRNFHRLSQKVNGNQARRASAEVVKQSGDGSHADGSYPIMQALDEEALGCDAQFGGVDQRKIFVLAAEILPKMGWRKRAHLMNPMVPGLAGGKMSSSEPEGKIDLLDEEAVVKKKLSKAVCAPGEVTGNGILAFIESVLLPSLALQAPDGQAGIAIGQTTYHSYADVKAAYVAGKITPQEAKATVTEGLMKLMRPIRTAYERDPEWQTAAKEGYAPIVKDGEKVVAGESEDAKAEEAKARKKAREEKKKAAARAFQERKEAGGAAVPGPTAAASNPVDSAIPEK